MYSRGAWDLIESKRAAGSDPPVESKTVVVGGRRAELRTYHGSFHPISSQFLIIDYGGTVVEARTGAVIPLTPTAAQPNSLIDEATFLAVLEHLRRYPE